MSQLYFEGRELQPWAEYMRADELRQGAVYFGVHYLDDEMLVPELTAFVFIGKDLEPDDENIIYFQEASSYLAGVRPFDNETPTVTDEAEAGSRIVVHTMKANECHMMQYENAVDVLLRCALRRRQRNSEATS